MTQQDLARALKRETGSGLSQSYLSQIESGSRPHLTNASRMLLARFFKVHPGYLVDDPEGYPHRTYQRSARDRRPSRPLADQWRRAVHARPGVEPRPVDVAKHHDTRKCLLLLGAILESPELVERLTEVLRPNANGGRPSRNRRRTSAAQETGGREHMTWALFYLVCFFVGVSLSVVGFLGGSWHLPHLPCTRAARHRTYGRRSHSGHRYVGNGASPGPVGLQLRNAHRLPCLVWRSRIPAHTVFVTGGRVDPLAVRRWPESQDPMWCFCSSPGC